MKIRPEGAERKIHGQTFGWRDMTRLQIAVINFAKAPRTAIFIYFHGMKKS